MAVSSIAVTREGTAPSIPARAEVEAIMAEPDSPLVVQTSIWCLPLN